MHNFNYNDPIDVLEFNKKINTILLDCNIKDIDAFINIKLKNIPGIATLTNNDLKRIKTVYDELNKNRTILYKNILNQTNIYKTFKGSDGIEYLDISLRSLNLSNRTIHYLSKNKINYYSQIKVLSKNDLNHIRNLGEKSINEILSIPDFIQLKTLNKIKPFHKTKQIEELQYSIFTIFFKITNISYNSLMKSIEVTYLKFDKYSLGKNNHQNLLNNENFIELLVDNSFIQESLSNYIIHIIDQYTYGCDESLLIDSIPDPFKNIKIVNKILNKLLNNKKIDILSNDNFVTVYEDFLDITQNYLNYKSFKMLQYRIDGKTLEEVGQIYDVTRERVRQIESKSLDKIKLLDLHYKFDYYFNIFLEYNISKEDFTLTFNDSQAYNYLKIRYRSTKKITEKKEFSEILKDKTIPIKIRKKCEKTIYKNYFYIDSKYIKCSRPELVIYIIPESV